MPALIRNTGIRLRSRRGLSASRFLLLLEESEALEIYAPCERRREHESRERERERDP